MVKEKVMDFINEHGRASFKDLSDNIDSAKVFIAEALFKLKQEKLIYNKYEVHENSIVLINFPYDS